MIRVVIETSLVATNQTQFWTGNDKNELISLHGKTFSLFLVRF